MWFYRFRNSAPFTKRVLKGMLIQKKEWAEAKVKTDFGAFNRFMEDKFEADPEPQVIEVKEEPKEEKPKRKAKKETEEPEGEEE